MNKITVFFIAILLPLITPAQGSFSHQLFDQVLQKYVDGAGLVNYRDLQKNRQQLDEYVRLLEAVPPADDWSKKEKLAYWINAYNAYTLVLIIDNYPVGSIKDIGSRIQIPFVNSPWDVKFIHIGGEEYDLNNIEHGIIRKEFDEPRIHFALVCAAVSCPKLQNRAYIPEKLDQQLDAAAREFLANGEKNKFISSREAELSKIFNWYGGDFSSEGSLISFLNQYAPIQLDAKANISWKDYNWALNEQN